MAKKNTTWMELVSVPVKAAVLAKAKDCGFTEESLAAFVADLFTTAYMSPQGFMLRLSRVKLGSVSQAEEEPLPLFAPPEGGNER